MPWLSFASLLLSVCPTLQYRQQTALHLAALSGCANTCKLLLSKGAKVDTEDKVREA